MRLGRQVNNFGVEAVFGRSVLHEYEMRAMMISRNIVEAYRARESSENWAEWEKAHAKIAESLAWAAEEYEKLEHAR